MTPVAAVATIEVRGVRLRADPAREPCFSVVHLYSQLWRSTDLSPESQREKLHREYKFGSFVEAFGWMSSVALCAERADHHPEWFTVYSKVVVDRMTHDAGGITDKDFALAAKMDLFAGRLGAK